MVGVPGARNLTWSLADPASLAFGTQPQNVVAGATMEAVTVQVLDGLGRVVTAFTGSVTLAKASGAGTLGGTLTVSAVAGVATFDDLQVTDGTGSHTLAASAAAGLTGATSDAFTVSSAEYVPVDIYGADFDGNASNYLTGAAAAPWAKAGSWHIAAWLHFDAVTSFPTIFARENSAQTTRYWTVFLQSSQPRFQAYDGGTSLTREVNAGVTLSTGTLYLLDFGYDADADETFARINAGTRVTGAAGAHDNSGTGSVVYFGRDGTGNNPINGRIGPIFQPVDGTLLSDADIAEMYASGVPRAFADLSSALRAKLDPAACFNMQETSGNRVSVDTNTTLTGAGTVGRALVYDVA